MKIIFKEIIKRCIIVVRRMIWRIGDSGWVRVHLMNGSSFWMIRLCGWTLLKEKGSKDISQFIDKSPTSVLYFQINRESTYSLDCIQLWLYVAAQLEAEYWFLCDNYRLAHKMLRLCRFPNDNIRFIRSKNLSIRKKARLICSQNAIPVTNAQMTPFYHAKENGITKFWKIDADDTMFLIAPEKVAQMIRKVETMSENKGMGAVSYDMWFSHMHGRHWSFGVTYISGKVDFTAIFRDLNNRAWMKKLQKYTDWYNLDWYFTYLKRVQKVPLGTFYLENCIFVHFGDLLKNPYGSWVSIFSEGKLRYPILEFIYKKLDQAVKEIQPDSWKIDLGILQKESREFLWNEICQMRRLHPEIMKDLGISASQFTSRNYIQF